MVGEIRRHLPEHARLLEGRAGHALACDLGRALLSAHAMRPDSRELLHRLGKAEFEAGRAPERLHRAFRACGRVGMRHLAAFARQLDISSDVVGAFGEAVFTAVDSLSQVSSAGYADARATAPDHKQRCRRQLLQHLLDGTPLHCSLAELARAADWELPAEVTAIALGSADEIGEVVRRVGDQALVGDDDPEPFLLVPGDARLPAGPARVAVGPRLPLGSAATSLEWARRTLDLVRRGVLPDAPVTRWEDHLCTHFLVHNSFLISALGERRLAPLAGLEPKQRAKMTETLLAWLRCRGGGAPEVAARLGLHPQTVRYRMRQLESLFGDQLDDPCARLELEIVLRAGELTALSEQDTDPPVRT
ncbi:helix-turn-helix domain-containing protein [Saccharopolyspora taberi]|uniref:Helix-turn-helix domain-containing protein n=1 Tax=Saccharopolyspora taberi TaxID=60895 RepID=A0ABN3VC63_9PSEU